jgi:Ca2+-binding EF-hand superfamily protein
MICARRILCVFTSLASSASGQDASSAARFLKALDTNGDGFVSREEWTGSGATFATLDVDLDGYLTEAELAHAGTPPKREGPVTEAVAAERAEVAIGTLVDPPDLFKMRCTVCHDERRVERATKNATGWATTVARMQQKKNAKITDKEAKVIVAWLERQRAVVAKAVAGLGSDNPARDWSFVIGGGDLHLFDRDHNGKLDAGELQHLVFERADLDGNGVLSPGEFSLLPLAADRRALFAKLDRDHNGVLSERELGVPESLIEAFDANHDGMLERGELPRARPVGGPYLMILAADAKTALELLDRNHDGKLSFNELERFPGVLQRFDANKDVELDAKELQTAVTAARAEGSYGAFDDFLTRYDLDGNGVVSRLEFPGSDALFTRLDVDGDGVIGPKDAPANWKRTDFSPEAQRWRQ